MVSRALSTAHTAKLIAASASASAALASVSANGVQLRVALIHLRLDLGRLGRRFGTERLPVALDLTARLHCLLLGFGGGAIDVGLGLIDALLQLLVSFVRGLADRGASLVQVLLKVVELVTVIHVNLQFGRCRNVETRLSAVDARPHLLSGRDHQVAFRLQSPYPRTKLVIDATQLPTARATGNSFRPETPHIDFKFVTSPTRGPSRTRVRPGPKLRDMAETTITPMVMGDYLAPDGRNAGSRILIVAYLIRTDGATILFDSGFPWDGATVHAEGDLAIETFPRS